MDLIRLEGEGNSVILTITSEQDVVLDLGETLTAELRLDSTFVRGTMPLWLFPQDLRAWLDVLDGLDHGHDMLWLEDGRTPEISLARDDTFDRIHFTVKDWVSSNTTVSLIVPITDAWFDDAYERLDRVHRTWPLAAD